MVSDPSMDKKLIDKYVTKWYVLTTLTSRYIGSPETVMDYDLRSIKTKGFKQFFAEIEAAELSDTFWNVGLVQRLETSAINSPYFNTFLAAQIHNSEDALFSKGTKISEKQCVAGYDKEAFSRFVKSKRKEIINADGKKGITTRELADMINIDYEQFRKIVNQNFCTDLSQSKATPYPRNNQNSRKKGYRRNHYIQTSHAVRQSLNTRQSNALPAQTSDYDKRRYVRFWSIEGHRITTLFEMDLFPIKTFENPKRSLFTKTVYTIYHVRYFFFRHTVIHR